MRLFSSRLLNVGIVTATSHSFKKIIFANDKFVAINNYGFYTSNDCYYWEECVIDTSTIDPSQYLVVNGYWGWSDITHLNGKFVAISGSIIAISTDLLTWNIYKGVGLNSSNYCAITNNGNKFIMLSEDGYIAESEDAINWTETFISQLSEILPQDIAYGNSCCLIVGLNGCAYNLNHGYGSWIIRTDVNFSLENVDFGNGIFVATGFSDKIVYFNDNSHIFNYTNIPNVSLWLGVSYCNNNFIIVSPENVAFSNSGSVWNKVPLQDYASYGGAAYGNNRYVIS